MSDVLNFPPSGIGVGFQGSAQGSVPAWHAASSAFLDTVRAWGIANVPTVGLSLTNTTAATAGVTSQYSPALELGATAWDTDDAVSRTDRWRIFNIPTSGTAISSALSFQRSLDGAAFSAVFSVNSAGQVSSSSSISSGYQVGANSNAIAMVQMNGATGLGTTSHIRASAGDYPLALINAIRGDAASNVVCASVYDRNAAAITNAATMKLHSFGWTNNADVYAELAAVYCDGRMQGASLTADGDVGGKASTTTLTNATVAVGANTILTNKLPNGYSTTPTWCKVYVGTTAGVCPVFLAT